MHFEVGFGRFDQYEVLAGEAVFNKFYWGPCWFLCPVQSWSVQKIPLYDCIGWLFSPLFIIYFILVILLMSCRTRGKAPNFEIVHWSPRGNPWLQKLMAEQLYSSTEMGLLGPGHRSLPFPARKATERVKGVKGKRVRESLSLIFLSLSQTQNSSCNYIALTFLKLR